MNSGNHPTLRAAERYNLRLTYHDLSAIRQQILDGLYYKKAQVAKGRHRYLLRYKNLPMSVVASLSSETGELKSYIATFLPLDVDEFNHAEETQQDVKT